MKIITCLFLFSVAFPLDEQDEISFLYGMLGHLNLPDDKTLVLQDTSIIYTGDEIKINVGYQKETHFYAIFKGSEGEFDLLYIDNDTLVNNITALSDTIYTTALHWTKFNDPIGHETFYLINSIRKQEAIIDLFKHYYKVNEKGKIKLAKKIQNEIDKINPEKKRDLNSISSRLAKPVVGGLTFRANNKDEIMDVSLTHSCNGRAGIAFKTILLVHK